MYYLVEHEYVGIDSEQYIDYDNVEIRTEPLISTSIGERNGVATREHGEYSSLDEARRAIKHKFGETRKCIENLDDKVIEKYKIGAYEPLCEQTTQQWARAAVEEEINKETSDAEILDLLSEFESEANSQGYTLDLDALESQMKNHRDQLNDESE